MISTLPQEDYDAVVCTYVIQDLDPEHVRGLAQYVKEHVRPGGYLALAAFLGKFRTLVETVRPQFENWKKVTTKK